MTCVPDPTIVPEHYAEAQWRIASGAWSVDPASGVISGQRGPIGFQYGGGYVGVAMRVGRSTAIVYAHRVVWEAVNGEIPDGLQVNHRNGRKDDNRLTNLELVTPAGNAVHASKTGLLRHGETNNMTRHSTATVDLIRLRVAGGERQSSVARELGMSRAQVSRIARGLSRTKG